VAAGAYGLLCVGTYLFVILSDRAASLARVEREVSATARLMRTHAAEALANGATVLGLAGEAYRDLVSGRAGVEATYRRLADLTMSNAAIGTIWAVDAQGYALVSSVDLQPDRSTATQREYYRAHLAGYPGVHVGPREVGTVIRRPRFTLSVAVRDGAGQLLAVAAGGVDSAFFESIYAAIQPQLGTEAALLRNDGERLAFWPSAGAAGLSYEPDLLSRLPASGTLLTHADDAVVAVEQITGLPLLVVARAPRGVALAAWRARSVQAAIPVLLALSAFGLLTWLGLRSVQETEQARADLEKRVKQRTEQLDLLLGELNHRVKNNLQLVSSLVQTGLASVKDPAVTEAMRDTAHRIAALAEVHRTLEAAPTAGVQAREYIETIVNRLHQSFVRPGQTIDLRIDAPLVELPTDHAVALGIAVNELVTNAFKHAFLGRDHGTVEVRMTADATAQVLTVSDDGLGGVADRSASHGSRILKAMVQRLGGEIAVSSGPTGTVATLTIPGAAAAPTLEAAH